MDDVLNAAVGVEAVMTDTYTRRQAVDMCITARNVPGVPVAFDSVDGGKAQVIYIDGLGWAVGPAS